MRPSPEPVALFLPGSLGWQDGRPARVARVSRVDSLSDDEANTVTESRDEQVTLELLPRPPGGRVSCFWEGESRWPLQRRWLWAGLRGTGRILLV